VHRSVHILMLAAALGVCFAPAATVCAQDAGADTAPAADGQAPANTQMSIEPAAAIDRVRRLAEQSPDDKSPTPADSPERKALSTGADAPTLAIEERALGSRSDEDRAALGSGNGWVLNTLTALGLVIGLVLLLRFAVARFGGRPAATTSRAVEVLSRTSVAPKSHVLLLRVGGRILVVGDSSHGLRPLGEVDDPDEVASLLQSVQADRETSMTNGFNRMLSRYTGAHTERDMLDDQGADTSEFQTDRARDCVSGLLGRVRAMSGRGGEG